MWIDSYEYWQVQEELTKVQAEQKPPAIRVRTGDEPSTRFWRGAGELGCRLVLQGRRMQRRYADSLGWLGSLMMVTGRALLRRANTAERSVPCR